MAAVNRKSFVKFLERNVSTTTTPAANKTTTATVAAATRLNDPADERRKLELLASKERKEQKRLQERDKQLQEKIEISKK